jgi:hypothetical protein
MSYIKLNDDEQDEMEYYINHLLVELSQITVPLKERYNVNEEKVRSIAFGEITPRFGKKIPKLSKISEKYPEIWKLIWRLGEVIATDIDWTSVQLNHNVTCQPHVDKNNKGLSVIVSFGNYCGSNLVIDNREFDTYKNPVIFDGSLIHFNTQELEGNKYSLVYFTI